MIKDDKKRINSFFIDKQIVHISTNYLFYNGYIVNIFNDYFQIDDFVLGIKEIFFDELKKPPQIFTGDIPKQYKDKYNDVLTKEKLDKQINKIMKDREEFDKRFKNE
jgi:hypothetical protein